MSDLISNDASKCVACNKCIRVCPIEGANVVVRDANRRYRVDINHEKCIACGMCIQACRHGSRDYRDDTQKFFDDLRAGTPISVFTAPAIRSNFDRWPHIITWLRNLGVKKIYDVSLGADICTWAHIRYIQKYHPGALITQPCPAIVNYILMFRHDLLPYLSPVQSPMLCTAIYMRKYENIGDRIAALSPCIAKTDEFAATGLVHYNVTFRKLAEHLKKNRIRLPFSPGAFDHYDSGPGSLYPMPGGLKENIEFYLGKAFRIDKSEGQHIVYDALDKFAGKKKEFLPDVFDVLNCVEGCNLGTGCLHNMDVFDINTVMDAARKKAQKNRSKEYWDQLFAEYDARFNLDDFIREYQPIDMRANEASPAQIKQAFIALGKLTPEERHFDCGACGSVTCLGMAKKIALGINSPHSCIEKARVDISLELAQNVVELEKEVAIRTAAEKELLDIKENLEVRIAERTHELSEANRHLSAEIETRRAAEEKAHYLAGHDPLTGLANRMLFNEQMQKAIGQSIRSGKNGALLFFDLDRFKQINDTLGHAVGDELLRHMAKTLQDRARKTDTAARLGGDEFAVVMTEIDQPENAAILAQDILRALGEPVTLLGNTLHVRSSIGIATFHRQNIESNNFESIIKNADMAMYQAKTSGGMRYCFFEQGLQEKIDSYKRINEELRESLFHHRFIPYFQPLYQTVEKQVLYLEVLARWKHPERGILSPQDFIENATKSEIIKEIDRQIFDCACAHAKAWENKGLSFDRLSFNILVQYLETTDFIQYIQKTLEHHQLFPQKVAFEISEYALLKDSKQVSQTLDALRDMGTLILVDHLEMERSSLQNLIHYPIDAVKISRVLTARIGNEKINATIRAIAAVAHATQLTLIAEGVENDAQWDFLQTLGCEIIQGYKHASPMSATDTSAYLYEHQEAQKARMLMTNATTNITSDAAANTIANDSLAARKESSHVSTEAKFGKRAHPDARTTISELCSPKHDLPALGKAVESFRFTGEY